MFGGIISKALVMILGHAYPAFECFKTLEKNRVDMNELRFWCQYWIIVALFSICERFGDIYISWVPLYEELKLAFMIYLWYPKTKGSSYVYETLLRPLVSNRDTDMERHLKELRLRAWDVTLYYWQNCTELGQGAFFQVINYMLSKSGNAANTRTRTRTSSATPPAGVKQKKHKDPPPPPMPMESFPSSSSSPFSTMVRRSRTSAAPAPGVKQKDKGGDRVTTSTTPASTTPSNCKVLEHSGLAQGAESSEKTFDKQEPLVEQEAKGEMYSNGEKTEEELQDLIDPSTETDGFLLGILFLLGECYEFEKDMLIRLWMVEGFIMNEPMEVTGAKYFEDLVTERYILCSSPNSLYKVNVEKLNKELDMITQKSNCLRLESTSQDITASEEILHVSVIGDEIDENTFKILGRFSKLRTLLFLGNHGSRLQKVPPDFFLCLEELRALDLSGTHITELPSSAEKMIHLRYLDLSWTFIELLPENIGCFAKLQTLKLKGCSRLQRLPEEMKQLIELRHLDLDILGQLVAFPEGVGALVKLRTLSAFAVGTEEGFKISELKYLNNLTGEFCIADLENVQRADEAKEASLILKRNIKKLELRWSDYEREEPNAEDESILKNLCPCPDLEEMQIVYYHGTSFPDWIAEVSFHKLVSIILFKCKNVYVLPPLKKLPSLQTLELFSLNSVTRMDFGGKVDQVAFPKLKKLAVDEMLNLENWEVAQEGDFPCLVKLIIQDCPKLSKLPSLFYLPSIKYLEVSGCTTLAFSSEENLSSSLRKLIVEDCPLFIGSQDRNKIQHVPSVWIDQVAIQSCEEDESDGES